MLVRTNQGEIKTRLLIDAMGSESPIVNAYKPAKRFWSCFGYYVEGMDPKLPYLEDNTSLILENVFESKPRIYFMFFPLENNCGYPIIFLLGNKRYSKEFMKYDAFEKVRKHDKYAKEFANAEFGKEFHGWIPLRRRPIKNLERLLFVGDAAGWAPPITGCGWNEGMRVHHAVAHNILDVLFDNDLSARKLNRVYKMSARDKMNRDLQAVFREVALNATDRDIANMIQTMHTIGVDAEERFIKCMMTGDDIRLAVKETINAIGIRRLLQLVPGKERLLIPRILAGERAYWETR